MAMTKVIQRGSTTSYKFEKKGDTILGYYAGTTVEQINGTPANKHVFITDKGALSVLGQINMYNQLKDSAALGKKVEVVFTGQAQKLKGGRTMKVYEVSVDHDDVLDTAGLPSLEESNNDMDEEQEESELADETPLPDEVPPPRAAAPRTPANTPSAASQARTKALLSGIRNKTN